MKQIHTIALLMLLQLVCSSAKISLRAETTDWFVIKFLTFKSQTLCSGLNAAPEQNIWFWYFTAGYHEQVRKEPSHVFAKINLNDEINQEMPLIQEKKMEHENMVVFLPLDFSEYCQVNLNFAHQIVEIIAEEKKFTVNINVSCNLLHNKEVEIRQKKKEEAKKKRQETMTKDDLADLTDEGEDDYDDYDQYNDIDDQNAAIAINIEGNERNALIANQNEQVNAKKKPVKKQKPKSDGAGIKKENQQGLQKMNAPSQPQSDSNMNPNINPVKKRSAKSKDAGDKGAGQKGDEPNMKI